MIFTNKRITTSILRKGLIITASLAVMSSLFFFSCKKKCYQLGNGIGLNLALYDANDNPIAPTIIRQIKFYYFKTNGIADTFRVPYPPEDNVVTSGNMRISTVDLSLLGILFQGFTTATLNNEVKDGYLYLLFPDGITDSMKVQVRNVEGCNIDNYNYYVDGLLYNGQQSEFVYKRPVGHIRDGANAFKAYIH